MIFAPLLLVAGLSGDELTLDRIFSDPPLAGRAPTALRLSPNGKYATFLKGGEKDSDVLDLWGAALPDGKPQLLVATDDLLAGKEQRLTEQERMALERKRISKRGITSYLWCGDDAKALVFPLSGDLYVVPLGGKAVRLTDDEDKPEQNPVCSKSGGKLAFVKDGDVVVMDIATRAQKKITAHAGKADGFGLAEFIAEEEMDRHEGMWWSPDEKSLLVFEVDQKPVGIKVRAQIFSDHTEMFEQRYPAAGEKNAEVSAWLVDVAGHRRVKLDTPRVDGYLPRAGFFDDGAPWIEWQSRDQKTLRVFEADRSSGRLRLIFEERDDAWVVLTDDFIPLKDGKRALWSTERSGRRQIVLVERNTGVMTPLTSQPEPVHAIEAVDEAEGLVFFSAWRDRGRELQAFSVPLAGGAAAELTPEPGCHVASFDEAGHFFVDRASDFGVPPKTAVRAASGKVVLVLDDNPASELMSYDRPTPEWVDLQAADGATVLNGLLLPPTKLDKAKRYPVIVSIYGGPGAQTVMRGWGAGYLESAYWTEHGFGVFLVDNRGMAGRGRAFNRAHDHAFGAVEVADLFAAVEQLKAVPWVDGNKLGVFGWSYGGFLAARAILDEKTPFAAAVAVAPVTDWTLYDTHYTERYLGMPPGPAYDNANLVHRAKLLAKPFLLMHGTADDNVLFEHSLRLSESLEKEGRLFNMMIYPGKAHGIAGKPSQMHVYKTISAFFEKNLQ